MSERPPAGWAAINGVIVAGERVADFAARGQAVKANCRANGCNRRVTIDPAEQVKAGLGSVEMSRLRSLWRCHRLDGCELVFFNEPPDNPLRLIHFIGRPYVRLRLKCQAGRCKFFRVWRVEEMVAGLATRRLGEGDRTEIDALGRLMTSACPICGKVNWAADVLWVDTETMGWKAKGERCFEAEQIAAREGPARPISSGL